MNPSQRKIKEWRENPIQFVWENFKAEPDEWQKDALQLWGRQDLPKLRISLRACVGPGKSALESWCGWNFLSCYGERGHHPKGAAVSVTSDNLKDNLWPEFSKWQSRSPFLQRAFTWSKERIFATDHPETWFLSARSYSKSADPEEQGRTLSGLHSKYVLVLIDESGEIPVPVGKAGEQAFSERDCAFARMMQAGNPSSRDGLLYAAASTFSNLWHNIRVTGDPDDPKRSPRIDIDWAKEQIRTHGRDNPWVMYAILGEFPPGSINALLGVDEVERAMERHYAESVYNFAQKRLGVDVALQGDDRTVIFPRQGLAAFIPAIMRTREPAEIAARVLTAKARWSSEQEFVDCTGGYGSGVVSHLRHASVEPIEVQFAAKATQAERYYNKRAEMWWEMAEWIKRGGALPKIPELTGELVSPTYTVKSGKLLIEPKDLVKKKLGRSPDIADALALTFAHPEMPAQMQKTAQRYRHQNNAVTEYDPFDPARF